MSSFDWESFLWQWSQAILESMNEDQLAQLPQDVIDSGWFGYPGATEEQICQAESRLGVYLPPSYRDFLKITNGWRQTTSFIRKLWSTDGIERFAARHPKWIEAFTNHHENQQIHFDTAVDLESFWEVSTIPDEEYLIYGEDQDCSKLRVEYLKTAIEISDVGTSAIYLLNPQVVTENGEWEAWFFGDWLPGADRYRSFQEMMVTEYQNFLDLRDGLSEQAQAQALPAVEIQRPPRSATVSEAAADLPTTLPVGLSNKPVVVGFETAEAHPLEMWQLLKRLTIEFQSRTAGKYTEYRTIATVGEDQSTASWPGLGEGKLKQWLRHHLVATHSSKSALTSIPPSASRQRSTTAATSEAIVHSQPKQSSIGMSDLKLEIDQLKVWQESRPIAQVIPPQMSRKQVLQGTLKTITSQKPFSVEIAFRLVGQTLARDTATHSVTYKAYFYVYNRDTGRRATLGETEPGAFVSGTSTCIAKLAEIMLEPGLYRLQVITTFQGVAVTPAYFEIPIFQVM